MKCSSSAYKVSQLCKIKMSDIISLNIVSGLLYLNHLILMINFILVYVLRKAPIRDYMMFMHFDALNSEHLMMDMEQKYLGIFSKEM